MLEVNELAFSYSKEKQILENVSFKLKEHDIMCLLGPNGTGKTTLLRCILGLNKIIAGSIAIEGKNISRINGSKRAKVMAYVPQMTNMTFQYDGFEVVLMGRVSSQNLGAKFKKEDIALVDDIFKKLQIEDLKDKFFNQMSGGEKQMLLIARAIAQKSKIIVMDEPTASLDYGNQVKILKVIKDLAKEGYSILMTSHYPDHAFLACNKVALLKGGSILGIGHPSDIVTTKTLTSLYETDVLVADAKLPKDYEDVKVCVPIM